MNAGVAPAVVGDWLKTFAQKHFLMRTYQNFIGGEWAAAKSGQSYRNVNPADAREVVAEYPASAKDDAVAAFTNPDPLRRSTTAWK